MKTSHISDLKQSDLFYMKTRRLVCDAEFMPVDDESSHICLYSPFYNTAYF